jgi:transcription initiation factor TFIID subunit 10
MKRKAKLEDQKQESLAHILTMMDDFSPVIPDAVTDYELARGGFICEDLRM